MFAQKQQGHKCCLKKKNYLYQWRVHLNQFGGNIGASRYHTNVASTDAAETVERVGDKMRYLCPLSSNWLLYSTIG